LVDHDNALALRKTQSGGFYPFLKRRAGGRRMIDLCNLRFEVEFRFLILNELAFGSPLIVFDALLTVDLAMLALIIFRPFRKRNLGERKIVDDPGFGVNGVNDDVDVRRGV
jgi:hypothetical protein